MRLLIYYVSVAIDCTTVTCTEPLTYTPPGSPCGCVWPIRVQLHLGVELYTFFPLVAELAQEIASSLPLDRKQVRIMGANSAHEQLERTTVLINLVPQGMKFNRTTALSIYEKFWHKHVMIKPSLFGAYEVTYVQYPGSFSFTSACSAPNYLSHVSILSLSR